VSTLSSAIAAAAGHFSQISAAYRRHKEFAVIAGGNCKGPTIGSRANVSVGRRAAAAGKLVAFFPRHKTR
jgi:hypothetical protein